MKMQFEVLKNRPKITIKLTRNSVAAGDDVDAPHEKSVKIHSFIDPTQFIRQVSLGYLPSVAGVGHTWDCILNEICVGIIANNGIKPSVKEITYSENNHVHFIYHSSTY